MKNPYKNYNTGMIALISPLPMIFVTMFWGMFMIFIVGIGILKFEIIPDWFTLICLFPIVLSPIYACYGIVYGIVNRKEKEYLKCIIFSIIGLLENFILIYGLYFIGSRF